MVNILFERLAYSINDFSAKSGACKLYCSCNNVIDYCSLLHMRMDRVVV